MSEEKAPEAFYITVRPEDGVVVLVCPESARPRLREEIAQAFQDLPPGAEISVSAASAEQAGEIARCAEEQFFQVLCEVKAGKLPSLCAHYSEGKNQHAAAEIERFYAEPGHFGKRCFCGLRDLLPDPCPECGADVVGSIHILPRAKYRMDGDQKILVGVIPPSCSRCQDKGIWDGPKLQGALILSVWGEDAVGWYWAARMEDGALAGEERARFIDAGEYRL